MELLHTTLTIIAIIFSWECIRLIFGSLHDGWEIHKKRLIYAELTNRSFIRIRCTPEKWQENFEYVIKAYAGDVISIAGTKF